MNDINLDADIDYHANVSDYDEDRGNAQSLAITYLAP